MENNRLPRRGWGRSRPYFYFRRNGRTIPAGTKRDINDSEINNEHFSNNRTFRGSRGRNVSSRRVPGFGSALTPPLSASFLRPENYVAPENAQRVHSIAINDPIQCEGWNLYFPFENYVPGNALAKRVTALQMHFNSDQSKYNLSNISRDGHFILDVNWVTSDAEVMEVWSTFLEDLRKTPRRALATLGAAMYASVVATAVDEAYSLPESSEEMYVPRYTRPRKVYVRPIAVLDPNLISNISSNVIEEIYTVRGIITFVGDMEINTTWIAYKCARCKQEQALRILRNQRTRSTQPTSCKNTQCTAKSNHIEMRSSPHTNLRSRQIIRIEESQLQMLSDFDSRPSGCIEIELTYDLVDTFVVGQEIIATGVLKLWELNGDREPSTSTAALKRKKEEQQFYLKAVSLQDARSVLRVFYKLDLEAIFKIQDEPDTFKLLVKSIAPEVHGNEVAKAACLLSLFGGCQSATTKEGPIHVLLIGEPGSGKSKILEMCSQISERSAHVSGKLGLQAGNKIGLTIEGRSKGSIQAGSLITANGGHCTIDDIDKISAQQTVALQAIQSQEINSPLTSLFCSISTCISVIASANPQSGRYDRSRLLLQNVRIMPTLLKEFHLVFVLSDKPSLRNDVSLGIHLNAIQAGAMKTKQIAKRYEIKPNSSMSHEIGSIVDAVSVFENNDLIRRLTVNDGDDCRQELDLLPPILMKKYIAYARDNINPLISDEAMNELKLFFKELRQCDDSSVGRGRVGIGQLMGLIRLCQARARVNLSIEVTTAHVRDVRAIVLESIGQTSISDSADDGMVGGASRSSKPKIFKRFLNALKQRSNAINRCLFDMDELKDVARRVGITSDLSHLIDIANEQGYLLKKGASLYELLSF